MRKKSIWKYKKKKKEYVGNYEDAVIKKKTQRFFVLSPVNGLGNDDHYKSWEDAKRDGWRKVK